jgi:hypothetical protein
MPGIEPNLLMNLLQYIRCMLSYSSGCTESLFLRSWQLRNLQSAHRVFLLSEDLTLKLRQAIALRFHYLTAESIPSTSNTHGAKITKYYNLTRSTNLYVYAIYIYLYTAKLAYTRCFTTCGHYCRRWFPRSFWSKKFIKNTCPILDGYGVMTLWNLE